MARARYASTVVLLRPDERGSFEILLTRRPPEMRFLGGFYVFPGGAVHQDDYSAKMLERCRGLSKSDAQKALGHGHDPELALGHWVAACRELFEEVGILVCGPQAGGPIDLRGEGTKKKVETKRREVVRETLKFSDFLETEGLYCDLSRMVYFFHRVTPAFYPIRFDTRFYLALLPAHQTPLARSEEVTHSLWIKPGEALSQAGAEFPVLPPTTTVLEDLAEFGSWDELRRHYQL
jgi:8-oxo-dGTP pyrophosphatase MutT (NUDIX family)